MLVPILSLMVLSPWTAVCSAMAVRRAVPGDRGAGAGAVRPDQEDAAARPAAAGAVQARALDLRAAHVQRLRGHGLPLRRHPLLHPPPGTTPPSKQNARTHFFIYKKAQQLDTSLNHHHSVSITENCALSLLTVVCVWCVAVVAGLCVVQPGGVGQDEPLPLRTGALPTPTAGTRCVILM